MSALPGAENKHNSALMFFTASDPAGIPRLQPPSGAGICFISLVDIVKKPQKAAI